MVRRADFQSISNVSYLNNLVFCLCIPRNLPSLACADALLLLTTSALLLLTTMAGPILSTTMFAKSTAHTLRAIPVVTFPLEFLLLLISGITSGSVNPAIGLVPLSLSCAFSVLLLANARPCGCQSSGLTGTPTHLVVDFALGTGILICLILTWIFLPQRYSGSEVMFGTYCTFFLIANFLVHFYFTFQPLYEFAVSSASYSSPSSCSYCVNNRGPFESLVQKGLRSGYAPLLDGQGWPNNGSEEERTGSADAAV